jgi:type IV secretion system protein VirD4
MSRNERWNTVNEIKRRFHETTDPSSGAGPIVYVENGRKYSDDSESHIAVIGRTGKGKSQCCSLPFMREILQKGESLIMLDPKGEGYKRNACYIPKSYQRFCVDFRNPRTSPTKWNPVLIPYRLFRSENPDDNDIASSMLSELWNGVYPYDGHSDRFWTDSSVNYAKGLTYGLFETGSENQINLDSVAIMMEQSETRIGMGTLLKSFYESLPHDSLAKRNLATYVTGPNDTRASIHSVAASGLEVFSRSKGLMEMLSEDTLNILGIDVDRPFILTVITPDETDVYDALAGLLVSQVTQHLIRIAQERGGKLPIRVNVILEELGSVGKAITQLPNLMVASRSRNIRIMLILQSGSAQLEDIYGKSKAEIINSCIGITIGFSTNSWETLNEWAHRCGERRIDGSSLMVKEPLITAPQLAAMPTGTALIMVDSQYKFVAHLPFFNEMYDNSDWIAPNDHVPPIKKSREPYDFEAVVRHRTNKSQEPEQERILPFTSSSATKPSPFDIDSLITRIDKQIANLEAEEEAERKKQQTSKKYNVVLKNYRGKKSSLAQIIASSTNTTMENAYRKMNQFPAVIASFDTKDEALAFARKVTSVGGEVAIRHE